MTSDNALLCGKQTQKAQSLSTLLQLKIPRYVLIVCQCMPANCGASTYSPVLSASELSTRTPIVFCITFLTNESVRPHQVTTYFATTFDALIRNSLYAFI